MSPAKTICFTHLKTLIIIRYSTNHPPKEAKATIGRAYPKPKATLLSPSQPGGNGEAPPGGGKGEAPVEEPPAEVNPGGGGSSDEATRPDDDDDDEEKNYFKW